MLKINNLQVFLGVTLALFSAGCGGSPTAPAPTADATQPMITTPTPPTPQPAPVPEPTPIPVPTPAPAPVPPEAFTRYTAHVDSVLWYGVPLFTTTFEFDRYADRIVIGSVTLPILYEDDRGFIARTSSMSFSVVDANWTFDGVRGRGVGTLETEP